MVGTLSNSSAEEWKHNLFALGGWSLARSFTAHPYSSEVVSLIGVSFREAEEFIKKKFGTEMEVPAHASAAAGHLVTKDGVHYVILFAEKWDIGAIVHECVHAASFIFSHAGITHDLENEEPYTYLVQRIFEACLGEHNERNRKRRKKTSR